MSVSGGGAHKVKVTGERANDKVVVNECCMLEDLCSQRRALVPQLSQSIGLALLDDKAFASIHTRIDTWFVAARLKMGELM